MEAAYRFFANEKVTFEQILRPHIDATRERLDREGGVILAQDTTEIDLTRPEQQVSGAGPLDNGSRRGVLLHEMHAFTPDGTPLGTVHAVPWVRADDDEGARSPISALSRAQRARIPIEEKESYRWVVALRDSEAIARQHPHTQTVCVADSEADIYELLAEATAESQSVDWIVRASQNRALRREKNTEADAGGRYLREALLEQPVLFTKAITARGRTPRVSCETRRRRQSRESRDADVEVAPRVSCCVLHGAGIGSCRT